MGYWKSEQTMEESPRKGSVKEYTPKETVKDVLTYPIRAIPERGIRLETAEVFGIRTSLSQSDGTTPTYTNISRIIMTRRRIIIRIIIRIRRQRRRRRQIIVEAGPDC